MKIKFSLFLLFLTFSAYAQKPTVQMYPHIPPEDARRKSNLNSELLFADDKELLISDRTKQGVVITSYNSGSMKKTGTFKLDYPEIGKKDADWVKRLFHTNNNITSIYGFYDKKEDENTIYGKITDRKNKTIVKEKVLMQMSAKRRRKIGSLSTYYSPDYSKILIIREPPAKKYDNEKMEMVLYDEDLNKIFEKELNFPYKNRAISVQQILLTNNGDLSIIAFWEPSKEELKADPELKDQITFKLFKVTENNENLEEIELTEKGYALSTCRGYINNDSTNSIVYFGFYKDITNSKAKKRGFGINGIYYINVNANTWEVDKLKFNLIDEKTMAKFFLGNATSDKAKKRAEKKVEKGRGLTNLVLKYINYKLDGSLDIYLQVEYVVESCTTDPKTGRTRCVYYYHNEQIIAFNLNKEGNLENTIIVPKVQVMMNTSIYNGHLLLSNKDKIFFVYNDNDRNYNPKKVAKKDGNNFYYIFTGRKKSRLCYVTLDGKGKLSKQPIVDSWKQNIFIYPYEQARVNDQTIITWGKLRKGKELVLVKVTLEGKAKKGR